jgi:hypothetical protein
MGASPDFMFSIIIVRTGYKIFISCASEFMLPWRPKLVAGGMGGLKISLKQ